jgi:predicted enzyme related to lactoylglutathione lyase
MSKCEHIELSTDATDQAKAFYAQLFKWKIQAVPDGGESEYLMFRTDNGGGGITAKMMPEQPTAWMPYFTVGSVKTSLSTATKLGASVVQPYMPIGDMGAIAVLRDPTGAAFGLWEMGKPAKPAPAKKPAAKSKPAAKAKKARK